MGGGRKKVLPLSWGGVLGGGGAQKVLEQRFSHFVDPLPVINDQFRTKLSAQLDQLSPDLRMLTIPD